MSRPVRRVVVTGLGLVTPLGNDVAANWEALQAGRSGIDRIRRFDAQALGLPVHIAGEVRDFDPARFIEKKEIKKTDAFTQYAIAAAEEAVRDADLRMDALDPERLGVVLGVGMGGLATLEDGVRTFIDSGIRRLSAFLVPRLIANMAASQVGMRFGAKGVNFVTTSACASGGHGVGEGFRYVALGLQDVVLAGGAEAVVTPLGIAGFAVMRALSVRNDEPARASRPFDRDRDGFVLAEGAAVLVLEELEHARRRGARIYAEIAGYGANSDAYHITAPSPEGEGAARCMRLALGDSGLQPEDIDYINAHGTSTPYNDVNETQAIKRVFGDHAYRLAVSSTKSMTGHAMGAAGAIEAAYTVLALHHQAVPPTVNYETPDPECDLDYVPNRMRTMPLRAALSNSFGFGGTNACLVFRRWT